MKNYKDFEKIYIGMSDGANLILDGGIGKLEYLFFTEDGNYMAYFVDEEIEIPQHYKKVYECEIGLDIYDDSKKTLSIRADKIEIYRAKEFGCLIYAPGGDWK